MKIKLAVVGAGYFSQYHYESWNRLDDVNLVALCDINQDRAAKTAKKFNVPKVFNDFDLMLKEINPDLVDIITPASSHMKLVRTAFENKTAIICQKPLAEDLISAKKMVELADDCGVFFAVHENFRFQPWFKEIKKILDQNMLGKTYSLNFRLRPGDGQGNEAYLGRQPYFQKMKRFLIHETGIHFIDTFRYLLGDIRMVYAGLRKLNPVIAGEDAGVVLFEFQNGIHAILDANRLVDHPALDTRLTMGEMLIEGSDLVLRLDGWGRIFLRSKGKIESEHYYTWINKGFAGDSVFECQSHLLKCMIENINSPILARNYLRNFEIEEAIYNSDQNGERIAV